MELKLYDTLTREKRVFAPLDPARVRMYVCGPTVYDFAHIGNARPVIVFDVLFRLLRHLYGADHVTYVRNITDVDDKINARAAERGISIRELTEETYKKFKEDVAALGCLPPTVEPRATEHIEEMKTLIERLVASGNAYVAEEHVLFSVPSMPDYGKLSKRSLDEMIAGARVDVAPYKRDPMDFVLWKPSKPGEPAWPSPAGHRDAGPAGLAHRMLGDVAGSISARPSTSMAAASTSCFRTTRTRSRSRAAPSTRRVMANFWMHNGFLQVEGEKMSKSARQLLHHPRGAGRLAGRRGAAGNAVDALPPADRLDREGSGGGREGAGELLRRGIGRRRAAPGAGRARGACRRSQHAEGDRRDACACSNAAGRKALAGTLAFFGFRRERVRRHGSEARAPAPALPAEEIERRIAARHRRAQGQELHGSPTASATSSPRMGVVLKDSKDGTTWEIAR